jgi:D-tagatose-1,6-bisphosphate aldolase subunit GatZ/KbaZ
MTAIDIFREILRMNKKGRGTGIYSVCSAHETVLKASMLQAKEDSSIVLIESTSNQVNQDGGYTGMRPQDFVDYVSALAQKMEFDPNMILLGGDHLGPHTWRHLPSKDAMDRANTLVREYVKAGYQKIHLDASMFLADDTGDRTKPLTDEIVASRAAELCSSAEQAWEQFRKGWPKPVYIIGTEVPMPGGAREAGNVRVTLPEDAAKTISIAKNAFYDLQLQSAWERVCGVVVQPGVEFSDDQVIDYNHDAAIRLSSEINNFENLIYETHSTDYQTRQALAQMVPDHFCILKVGPWLTFTYREALFVLVEIEKELYEDKPGWQSFLRERLEKIMVDNPKYWENHYSGTGREKKFKRKFSYLDRIRYFWPDESLCEVKEKLYSNLKKTGIPLVLISQYMPNQYFQVRQGRINCDPEELVLSKIRDVLRIYSNACCMKTNIVNIKK